MIGLTSGGSVSVTVSHAKGVVSGVLALFDFQVASGVQPGTNLALDLSGVSLDGRSLNSVPGADGTDGRISVVPTLTAVPLVSMNIPAGNFSAGANDTMAAISPTRVAQASLLGDAAD